MDFAAGLANLEQSASNAQNRNDRRRGRPDQQHHHREDDRRYQPRPRRDNYHGGRGHGHHHHHAHHRDYDNPSYDRALVSFVRAGYRLPRGPYRRPPPISATSATDRPLHICLLTISIDDLPYEAIWKAWAAKAPTTQRQVLVSLICHAKHPEQVQSKWLQQRMLLRPRRIVRGNSLSDPEFLSHKPAWGSVQITRAMIDLLVQGMEMGRRGDAAKEEKDPRFSANRFLISDQSLEELSQQDVPPADKFIFVSETCIPVTTLDECAQALFATSRPTPTPPQRGEAAAADSSSKTTPSEPKESSSEADRPADEGDSKPKEEDPNPEATSGASAEDSSSNKETGNDGIGGGNHTATESGEEVLYLDTSWVNARNFNTPGTPHNMYERDQFSKIHRLIPKRYRWKADQWMVLSRTHAAAILDLDHSSNLSSKDHLWNSFRHINASDEMYFPTTLALAGVLLDTQPRQQQQHQQHSNPSSPPAAPSAANVASSQPQEGAEQLPWLEKRRVTYTDWSVGMRNPASFTEGVKDFKRVARLARKQKCLFARKFAPFLEIPGQDASQTKRTGDISVEEWQMEMGNIIQEEEAGKSE